MDARIRAAAFAVALIAVISAAPAASPRARADDNVEETTGETEETTSINLSDIFNPKNETTAPVTTVQPVITTAPSVVTTAPVSEEPVTTEGTVDDIPFETEPPVSTAPVTAEPVVTTVPVTSETTAAPEEPAAPDAEAATHRAFRDASLLRSPGGSAIGKIAAGEPVYAVEESGWLRIIESGETKGYCSPDDFVSASVKIYASLPVEYGTFRIGEGETHEAYSHLVDVAEYNDALDVPMIIDMKLSRDDPNSLFPRKAFYRRNLCMLQYDAVKALLVAQSKFVKYGYTIKICDAYRPTSVQRSWFSIVRVHKWVASPDYGDGGMHDRGVAVDITLVDIKTGKELEMPTAMHTFSEDSARTATNWSEAAKANVSLMTNVMVSCGFTTISSEWWHFQLADKNKYLPTDHPIDSIPLVLAH